MPVTLDAEIPLPLTADRPRKRWTREEFLLLEQAGVGELSQYELIEGALIRKKGKKLPHILCLLVASKLLRAIFGYDLILQEPAIDVSPEDTPTSVPEPDLVLLTKPAQDSGAGSIRPSDIRLVIEVSDITLRSDLTAKAPLYARAGIAEYWVLDLTGRRTFVHRDPLQGIYSHIAIYSSHESIASLANPDAAITVSDLFPPHPQGA